MWRVERRKQHCVVIRKHLKNELLRRIAEILNSGESMNPKQLAVEQLGGGRFKFFKHVIRDESDKDNYTRVIGKTEKR